MGSEMCIRDRLESMESRVCPGLHLAGEILDVDGRIGGFNFQGLGERVRGGDGGGRRIAVTLSVAPSATRLPQNTLSGK